MIREPQKFTVTMVGRSYTLISDEDEREILEAVKLVDSTLKEILVESSTVDMHRAATLAALKIALLLVAHKSEQEKIMSLISHADL